MTLKAKIRMRINNELYKMTYNTYFKAIPIDKIIDIVSNEGFTLLNEDYTEFEAIFCGRKANINIDIGHYGKPFNNCMLRLSWYKMPSGNYEIVTYLS